MNVFTYRNESYLRPILSLLTLKKNTSIGHWAGCSGKGMMAILIPFSLWELQGVLSLIITMPWTAMFAYVYVARQYLQVDGPKRLSQ